MAEWQIKSCPSSYLGTREGFLRKNIVTVSFFQNCAIQARSRGGGSGGSADPPLENQRSTFWNLAREIIKANNYKWLTIYLHQLLCTKPPTKWLQNLLSKGGSGGANL